nr:hypothetical protein OH826_13605 [Streptomyces sp. NBC_00899]
MGREVTAGCRAAGRVSFLVQSEVFPYRYVSVESPVVLDEPTDPEENRARSVRYLGEEIGRRYADAVKPTLPRFVTLAIRPRALAHLRRGQEHVTSRHAPRAADLTDTAGVC